MGMQVPPFFQYAIMSESTIKIEKDVFIGSEGESKINAILFSNEKLEIKADGTIL